MLHIYAALAEKERRVIDERTRAGLAAAKKCGVKLGWLKVSEGYIGCVLGRSLDETARMAHRF